MQANVTLRGGVVSAEEEGEKFDIYDEQNVALGFSALRADVHAQGLWHRAVYCFLYDPSGRLLLQQRSPQKRTGPGQWDLSVAEHLQPGESYRDAAIRGLEEELGIECVVGEAGVSSAAVVSSHARRLDIPAQGIRDYEFVESYELRGYAGPIDYNINEVQGVSWVDPSELCQRFANSPQEYTQWFREEWDLMSQQRHDADKAARMGQPRAQFV